MDFIFFKFSLSILKWVDAIKKSTFEKQLVLLSILFMIMNHFSPMVLIRIYLVARYGQCSLKDDLTSTKDQTYAWVQQNFSTNVDPAVKTEFLESQAIALGCGREMRLFFTTYIIMNFFLSVVRTIHTKISVDKIQNRMANIAKEKKMEAKRKVKRFRRDKSMKSLQASMERSKAEAQVVSSFNPGSNMIGKADNVGEYDKLENEVDVEDVNFKALEESVPLKGDRDQEQLSMSMQIFL